MDGRLLVRIYNVGLGDCIYLRVPDARRHIHILIDCGNKFSDIEVLRRCIRQLKQELHDTGQKGLDLLVVTHPHEDHHKGFEEDLFGDLKIDHIWLSPGFDRLNPQAKGFHALQDAVTRGLTALRGMAFGDAQLEADALLSQFSLSNAKVVPMLTETLPRKNGIKPLFVSAETPQDQLLAFDDEKIALKVLAPMKDIDGYYLGGVGQPNTETGAPARGLADGYSAMFPAAAPPQVQQPPNISSQDFARLRQHILSSALAAARTVGEVANNLSVVLLLEWRGRRLLFPGDAQWDGANEGQVKRGRSNGSWNVMWQERRDDLLQPLDFLKIGHHGSENATPWAPPNVRTSKELWVNQVLAKLLPAPTPGQTPTAQAIVSTQRTKKWPSIPDPAVMQELGRRVANVRTGYQADKIDEPSFTFIAAGVPQPQRTDFEEQVIGAPVSSIELEFAPV